MFWTRKKESQALPQREGIPGLGAFDYLQAAESGRRRAAWAVYSDPEARRRVEGTFGKDYCVRRYPEAYGKGN